MSTCPICEESTTVAEIIGRKHRCLPLFEVQYEGWSDFDDDEPCGTVHAWAIEDAAEVFAGNRSSDLEFYDGEMEFRVRAPGDEWSVYVVVAEPTVVYSGGLKR